MFWPASGRPIPRWSIRASTSPTCYGARSQTAASIASPRAGTWESPRYGKYHFLPPSTIQFEPTDVGAACFDAQGRLVATHERSVVPDIGRFMVFDPDDVADAVARAKATCGFVF